MKKLAKKLASGQWAPGTSYNDLKRALATRLDIPSEWVVLTDSCTTALAAAGRIAGPNSDLRVCPLTWPSTYAWHDDLWCAEEWPTKWVDCDDAGFPVSSVDVGVDLWGRPHPRMEHLPILDAAHRLLASEHGEYLASGAVQAITYSFAPQKEVPCWQGGALVSPRAADVLDWLGSGARGRVYAGGGGVKGLLPDVAASFILHQARHHDHWKKRRQDLLQEYSRHLSGMLLTKPGEASGHLAVIDCGGPEVRRMYQAALEKKPSIQHGHHYPLSQEQRAACPSAAALSDRILTLPLHTQMTRYDVRRVVARLLSA